MLTLTDLEALAKAHDLDFRARFPETTAADLTPPRPTAVSIRFKGVKPDAWRTLMTNLTEVDVSISGTRTVTGSGATDDMLFPEYRAMLPEVNARRAEIGLQRVHG